MASGPASWDVLAPLLKIWRSRGQLADTREADPHGSPPEATLSVPLDRRALEAEVDLGPLLAWWPVAPGRWSLVDTVTGAQARTSSATRRPLGEGVSQPVRRRVRAGYAADVRALRSARWEQLSAAEEVAGIRQGTRSEPTAPGRAGTVWCRRPAVDVLAGVSEVLAASATATSIGQLPGWFVDACEPERDDEGWVLFHQELAGLDPEAALAARRRSRWTAATWLAAARPGERLWCWWDCPRVEDEAFALRVTRAHSRAPLGSLKWLLTAAGATECRPAGATFPGLVWAPRS